MLHLETSVKYYLYANVADMRKSFNGLSGIVANHMQFSPIDTHIFVFINRRRDQLKLLKWDGDGFAIYHKKLEKGCFEIPAFKAGAGSILIDHHQLQFILQGVVLRSVQMRKRYQHSALKVEK